MLASKRELMPAAVSVVCAELANFKAGPTALPTPVGILARPLPTIGSFRVAV